MDNASKALIIAGAVLIAVMLVSVGVLVYNRASGTISTALSETDRLQIELENKKYDTYAGNAKGRDHVVQLLGVVRQAYLSGAEHTVEVTFAGDKPTGVVTVKDAATGKTSMDNVQKATNLTYNIAFTKDNSGYINKCTITGKK